MISFFSTLNVNGFVFSPAHSRTKRYDPASTFSSGNPQPPDQPRSIIPSIGQPTGCVSVVPSGLVIAREQDFRNVWGMTGEFLGSAPTQNRIASPRTYLEKQFDSGSVLRD